MTTVPQFKELCKRHGSDVLFHRDESVTPCPCRTPEGFRDPVWHLQHPTDPICNEAGMLSNPDSTTELIVKGFVQPVQSAAVRRLTSEMLLQMFGGVQADDHIGIFPVVWNNVTLNFYDWGRSGEDYLTYNGREFIVVSSNLIPDPSDGNPFHHWETGLRLAEVD